MPAALAIVLLGAFAMATQEISGNMEEGVSVTKESDGGTSIESTVPMRSYTDESGMTTWVPESV